MITRLAKFDSVAKAPFSTFYTRVVLRYYRSGENFLIGYVGVDKHLNMLLQSSYCTGKVIHYVTLLAKIYLL